MEIKFPIRAEYSQIFPELSESLEGLLVGIPKKLLLQAGTTFLLTQTIDDKDETLPEVIGRWFCHENDQYKTYLIAKLKRLYSYEYLSRLVILTPISSLKLIQLGLIHTQDEPIKERLQIEIDIFKIYLLLNEQYTNLQVLGWKFIEQKYPDIKAPLWLINTGFATSEFTNFVIGREYFCQTVKFLFLYKYLKNEERLSAHLNAFCKYYDVSSLEDYSGRVQGVIKPIAKKIKEGTEGFIGLTARNEEEKEHILKLSVQEYTKEEDIDFKVIRSAPLIQISDYTFRISHPVFITDKLYKSIYFDLNRINDSFGEHDKISNFRQFYTSNFSEKYLLYKIIKYCLKDRYIQYSGAELERIGISGNPDYYIRNGKYIFLIENKDVLFSGKIKDPPMEHTNKEEISLFEKIEMKLKKKFLIKDNGQRVGIGQIVDNIKRVLKKKNDFDKNYKSQNVVIFPVLIVHDIVYDCPGLNILLNYWFQQEVATLRDTEALPAGNIRPLIILNIDSLIRCAELLREGKLTLKDMIESYYEKIKIPKRNFISKEEMRDAYTNTYLSSTEIIEEMCMSNGNYAYLLQNNKILEYAFKECKL